MLIPGHWPVWEQNVIPSHFNLHRRSNDQLRQLTRQRTVLVESLTALKLRLHEELNGSYRFIQKLLKDQVKGLQRLLDRLEKEMITLLGSDPRLKADFELLRSIPGVGLITAAVVLGELGDLNRFKRSRQISAMVGVCPKQNTSGKSVRGRTVLSKKGNYRVRKVLYMAALITIRGNSSVADFYRHLLDQGKNGKSALCAVMRKLLVLMRALVISRKGYDPGFNPAQMWSAPVEKLSENFRKLRLVPRELHINTA